MPARLMRLIETVNSGNPIDASDALERLTSDGFAADADVVTAVLTRVRSGGYILNRTLCDWMTAVGEKSTPVFNELWGDLSKDAESIWRLLSSGKVASTQVEEAAMAFLIKFGSNPGEPYRPFLLQALGANGSARSLPWLRQLLDEYQETFNRKSAVQLSAPNALTNAEAGALKEASELCIQAIQAIELRAPSAAPGELLDHSFLLTQSHSSSTYHLARARHQLDGPFPGGALNCLRHHLEAICDMMIARLGLVLSSKGNSEKLSEKLGVLQKPLQAKDRWLFAQMMGLNKLTDFGSHHSDDFINRVTRSEVKPVLEISESIDRRLKEIGSLEGLDGDERRR